MISTRYKFIFIHIPKTGGNSIQTALAPHADDKLVFRRSIGNVIGEDGLQGLDVYNEKLGFLDSSGKHASVHDYYLRLGEEIKSYFIFTAIRNPWDRVISQTAFLTKEVLKKGVLDENILSFPSEMIDYISIDGKLMVHNFIKFENLQNDFDEICMSLGIPKTFLPRKNQSNRLDYWSYYNDATRCAVAERYKEDISIFNYKFQSNSL